MHRRVVTVSRAMDLFLPSVDDPLPAFCIPLSMLIFHVFYLVGLYTWSRQSLHPTF